MSAGVRRIVTGHDDEGKAIVISDGPPERVQSLGPKGPIFYELWNTRQAPVLIDRRGGEPAETGLILAPPERGTRIRILDIAPEDDALETIDAEESRRHFELVGAGEASTNQGGDAPHPFMHRTETIDYGIVLEGEITLILDRAETLVRAGDVVIQKGTNHAWANRSGRNCRIAFILIDGCYEAGL
ncbi:cupin domain-containing protein [Phenylobacterium montanum]|uniref:Cupin domain-containing protein n=1 Tax=Phenylobacterium montanum TaxID=2823693 RepID=A0A975FV23_9CAUL|nr:cupin domain-containing protein [Caulobacter sp. S6]QUD85940.1 cupin domain-containing protein [Caulobacter sp. S6]